ncbi:MAG: peptidoglycan-binding protein [Sandaracinaceae bacterium]|nr:peptidoglycan-binding protein [Sandaracinaceae bacterium]
MAVRRRAGVFRRGNVARCDHPPWSASCLDGGRHAARTVPARPTLRTKGEDYEQDAEEWFQGEAVTALQKQLVTLGYAIKVDGDFGAGTEKAVLSLQGSFGYDTDGIVGPGTQGLIDAQIGYGWNATAPDAYEKAQKAQGKTVAAPVDKTAAPRPRQEVSPERDLPAPRGRPPFHERTEPLPWGSSRFTIRRPRRGTALDARANRSYPRRVSLLIPNVRVGTSASASTSSGCCWGSCS